jgi:hypothetical protein
MKLNTKYKVLTPNGFKSFAGVDIMGTKPTVRLELENSYYIECTNDHKFFTDTETRNELSNLEIGTKILTDQGYKKITSITPTGKIEKVYDLIEVEGGHRFYANGMLVSNCKFVTFEETLLNPAKFAALDSQKPLYTEEHVRWYKKPNRKNVYCVALDPSMGTGGDDSAIQILELPSMTQVGEWQHNKTPVEGQVRVLNNILEHLRECGIHSDNVYWSVESNTLGEAVLVVLRDTGEENFFGTFLHDTRRDIGAKNRRKGFITTNKTKLEACSKIKSWVESDKLKLHSASILSQFKVFIRTGTSYAAKSGEKDDLVMALVLAVRMSLVVAGFDDQVYGAVNSNINYDPEYDEPLPIVIL